MYNLSFNFLPIPREILDASDIRVCQENKVNPFDKPTSILCSRFVFIMQLTLLVQGSGNVKKRFGKLVDFSKSRNYRGGSTGLPYIVSLKKLNKVNENN